MSFRVKACAATVAAACVLFTPAALASPGISHAPVQVTGKQLKNGLLPPTGFLPGYKMLFASNSGGKLEHFTTFHIPSMKCSDFWLFNGDVDGFGETAFATESATFKSISAPVQELFEQSVYQFASNHTAATVYAQIGAKYKSCKSVSSPDGHGGKFKQSVHSRVVERVGGHMSGPSNLTGVVLLTGYLACCHCGCWLAVRLAPRVQAMRTRRRWLAGLRKP
jgi:hypothetical protein